MDFLSNALQEAYRTAHTVRQRHEALTLVELRRNRERCTHLLSGASVQGGLAHIRHMRRLLAGRFLDDARQSGFSDERLGTDASIEDSCFCSELSRRRQLIALRRLARKHDDLLRERQRLERRRHLVHLLMVRPRNDNQAMLHDACILKTPTCYQSIASPGLL